MGNKHIIQIDSFKSNILKDLYLRGYLYQFTNFEAINNMFYDNKKIVFYIGYDPTAESLHVGHLLWIRLVKKLGEAGLQPIVLVGGATGKIGDPTWKETQRKMLTYDTILQNMQSINRKLKVLLGDSDIIFVNNDDWLSKLNYIEFLRDFGALVSVNKMLTMDSVSTRLQRQQHLSFLEFNYMLLQAYDFFHLFNNFNCVMQIGGQDQWSNMIAGIDLIRRKTGQEVFGMSIQLLTCSDGKKMGKTEAGTIWLDEKLLSPFDFWQYWRNVDDKDVIKLLKIFSDLPLEEIEKFEQFVGHQKINDAKILLADTITSFVHPDANIEDIKASAESGLAGGLEKVEVAPGQQLDKVLVQIGLSDSATQAKRLIESGAVKIDDVTIGDYKYIVDKDCIIKSGKKKFKQVCVGSDYGERVRR